MKKIILFILTLIIFFFGILCKKDAPLFEIKNLNGNEVKVFGHGGSGVSWKFPIDTWESIENCLKIGADGSEMDVQMTKDCVLVAYHHTTLEEATGCNGVINDKLWSEIEGCHFYSPLSSHLYLMRVDDIFSRVKEIKNYTFTFDCKLYTNSTNVREYFNQYADAIIKIIDKYQLEDNILIESPKFDFLKILKSKRNILKLFIYPSSFERGLQIAKELNLFGITIDTELMTKEKSDTAHSNGFRVTLWNIQTQQENIETLQKNPDYVQTDKIRHLLKITGKYKK